VENGRWRARTEYRARIGRHSHPPPARPQRRGE